MHTLVDISAHGLGHLAQTAPVLVDAKRTKLDAVAFKVRVLRAPR
jgi:hypothetical protein